MIKEMNPDTFKEDIQSGSVLLDFYSATCGPCKMLDYVLKDVDKDYVDDVSIIQISFDDNPDLVKEYDVEGYPTMIMLKDGKEVDRQEGLQQKPKIEAMIKEAL